jgi:ribosomal protein S18 acetylase RimI-like enzyme
MTPLDDPVRTALTGPQAHLAVTVENAIRFRPDVAPFMAPTADAWRVVSSFEVVQMTAGVRLGEPAPEALALSDADVPEMLALTQLTNPGPFLPRTIEMGDYIGIRDGGELVAMAGERFHVPGWTEISAVCTAPTHRGQGLATRLLRAVAAGIEARGEGVFLHVVATNTGAIRLYEALGFSIRGRRTVGAIVPSGHEGQDGADAVPHGVALIASPPTGAMQPEVTDQA